MNGPVFISYNSRERTEVTQLTEALQRLGVSVWLDFQQAGATMTALARAFDASARGFASAIVCLGDTGPGGWQSFESRALLRAYVEQGLSLPLNGLVELPVLGTCGGERGEVRRYLPLGQFARLPRVLKGSLPVPVDGVGAARSHESTAPESRVVVGI